MTLKVKVKVIIRCHPPHLIGTFVLVIFEWVTLTLRDMQMHNLKYSVLKITFKGHLKKNLKYQSECKILRSCRIRSQKYGSYLKIRIDLQMTLKVKVMV